MMREIGCDGQRPERTVSDPNSDPMPVFPIKAKDNLALETILAYRLLCLDYGLVDQAIEVDKAITEIQAWRKRNPELTQWPDHIHVPAQDRSER